MLRRLSNWSANGGPRAGWTRGGSLWATLTPHGTSHPETPACASAAYFSRITQEAKPMTIIAEVAKARELADERAKEAIHEAAQEAADEAAKEAADESAREAAEEAAKEAYDEAYQDAYADAYQEAYDEAYQEAYDEAYQKAHDEIYQNEQAA
jgi:hypothetical protein